MNKHPTSSEVATPLASTQPEDLQTALDDIAALTGRMDGMSEVIDIAFGRLAEIGEQLERLEALS